MVNDASLHGAWFSAKQLEGKVAVITGASKGLGRGFSLAMAAAGADVVLVGRSIASLDQVADEVRRLGRSVFPFVCDVTDVDAVVRLFAALPRVDILINNAGTNAPMPFLSTDPSTFDTLLSLNLRAAFFVAQAAVRNMVAAGRGGVIINISSQMGHVGATNRSVYCSTKHAIEGLTKALAVELADENIRVNAIAPTYVDTPLTKPYFEDAAFRTDVLSRIPLGRIATVADVTSAAVFLASPAAQFITGASLLIDGGYTAQ